MLRYALRNPLAPVLRTGFRKFNRFIYSFDGVDDRGQLQFRAINPEGDIRIKFRTGSTVPTAGQNYVIVSQMISSTFASREFALQTNTSNSLQILVGGVFSSSTGVPIAPNSSYEVSLVGTVFTVICNGVVQFTGAFTRGTAREPNAVTAVASRISNGVSTWGFFYLGPLFDVEINGTLWPMGDNNQQIQLPSPSGLGAELITPTLLANPAIKGSQWTYLGDGRWQYVGDGSFNELAFLVAGQPEAGFLELEVESISGRLRCYSTTAGVGVFQTSPVITSVGKFRYFYSSKSGLGGNSNYFNIFRDGAGMVASCVIKNISFRPLWVAGPTELVTNGDFSSATGWSVGPNTSISGGVLQVTDVAASSVTHRPVSTVNTKQYLLKYTVSAITGGAVRVNVYGNGTHYVSPDKTAAGTYTEVVTFNISGGSFTNAIAIQAGHAGLTTCTVDNVSLQELSTVCNPMLTSNFNPDRWKETEV